MYVNIIKLAPSLEFKYALLSIHPQENPQNDIVGIEMIDIWGQIF